MRFTTWLSRFVTPSAKTSRSLSKPRFRPSFEHLECRRVLTTLLVSPTGMLDTTPTPFASIQSAVDAAAPGDTILVGPGTYQEQVLITKDGLDLEASAPGTAVIQAPTNDVLAGNQAVVDIQGAQGVTLDGFTVMGPGPSLTFGVYVEGGSATIENNHVTRIGDDPSTGFLAGTGIEVGLAPASASALGMAPTTGSAMILGNTVDGYQANGIVVDNAGSSASIFGNTVTGMASDLVPQNGIVVSNGAMADIEGNRVSSNLFTLGRSAESAGILLSNPGAGVKVMNNTLSFNDAGIVAQGAVDAVFSGNDISGCLFDGVQLMAGTTGTQVTSNLLSQNGLDGVFVNADGNTIAGNTMAFNSEDGVQLLECSGNVVEGNTITGSARYGISEFLSADQANYVGDNTVFANGIGDVLA